MNPKTSRQPASHATPKSGNAPKKNIEPSSLTEAELLKKLMLDKSKTGVRLFRNLTGVHQLKDGRWLTSGLCVGSSDLIGYLPVVITPEMVGRTIAVFVAVEAKGPGGRVRPEQQQFIDAVNRAGAIGVVAWEPDLAPSVADWMARVTKAESAQSCGCDPAARWTCERHQNEIPG